MATPGKLRTYKMELKRPFVQNNDKGCNDFLEYIKKEITGPRKLISYSEHPKDSLCIVTIEMSCWSCGKNGPNSFRKRLFIKFPDANSTDLKRTRRLTPASKKLMHI